MPPNQLGTPVSINRLRIIFRLKKRCRERWLLSSFYPCKLFCKVLVWQPWNFWQHNLIHNLQVIFFYPPLRRAQFVPKSASLELDLPWLVKILWFSQFRIFPPLLIKFFDWIVAPDAREVGAETDGLVFKIPIITKLRLMMKLDPIKNRRPVTIILIFNRSITCSTLFLSQGYFLIVFLGKCPQYELDKK